MDDTFFVRGQPFYNLGEACFFFLKITDMYLNLQERNNMALKSKKIMWALEQYKNSHAHRKGEASILFDILKFNNKNGLLPKEL